MNMAFTRVEILEEFVEAARGHTLHPLARLERNAWTIERSRATSLASERVRALGQRKALRRALRAARAPYATPIPLPTSLGACGRCGRVIEHRAGLLRPIHFGPCIA